MFCLNCGKEISDGSKFCPYCGAKIDAPAQAEASVPPVQEDYRPTQEPITTPTAPIWQQPAEPAAEAAAEETFQPTAAPNPEPVSQQTWQQPAAANPEPASQQTWQQPQTAQQWQQPQAAQQWQQPQNYGQQANYQGNYYGQNPVYPMEQPKKKSKAPLIIALVAAFLVVAAGVVAALFFIRANNYKKANELMATGQYAEAQAAFQKLGGYKDSENLALDCEHELMYEEAVNLMDAGQMQEARSLFSSLGDLHDSATRVKQIDYTEACDVYEEGDYATAKELFQALGGYKDSSSYVDKCQLWLDYEEAVSLMDNEEYEEAIELFERLAEKGVADSEERLGACQNFVLYNEAMDLYDSGKYYDAYVKFQELGEFENSPDMALECIQPFNSGEFYHNPGYISNDVTFKVTASTGSKYAIVKLYTADGILVCGFYIAPGKTLQTTVPVGTYKFRFAHGTNWFGEEDLFGDDGFYADYVDGSSSTYNFKSGSTWTFTVRNSTGNGSPVDRSEF